MKKTTLVIAILLGVLMNSFSQTPQLKKFFETYSEIGEEGDFSYAYTSSQDEEKIRGTVTQKAQTSLLKQEMHVLTIEKKCNPDFRETVIHEFEELIKTTKFTLVTKSISGKSSYSGWRRIEIYEHKHGNISEQVTFSISGDNVVRIIWQITERVPQ